jgi:hypothetical protein
MSEKKDRKKSKKQSSVKEKYIRRTAVTITQEMEKNIFTLTGTKKNEGLCRNRQQAIEFSLRLAAGRLRLGLEMRPIMNIVSDTF